MKFNESTLRAYAAPLSDSENAKCKRAIAAIRDALRGLGYTDDAKEIGLLESDTFAHSISMRNLYSTAKIHVFIQGSYANNTCVRNESDVDIAVVREDKYEYAFGTKFASSTEDQKEEARVLKDAVEKVLRENFPYQVRRGNKSLKVSGTDSRKPADVVPCFSMHYYFNTDRADYLTYHDGIIIFADDGTVIRNFPKQHISNGKTKNGTTNGYYKKMVRIMKKMRHLMSDCGYSCADKVSSFGLESLLWNIPDDVFKKYINYRFVFDDIIQYLKQNQGMYSYYTEANGIKKLCPTQKDVDAYCAFINALDRFYQYDINE